MPTNLSIATLDRLGNQTRTSHNIADAATDPQIQAIADAWDAVLLGADVSASKAVITTIDVGSQSPPANVNAERKNKWLYRVQDSTTGQIYPHEMGTADNSQLPAPNTDFLDLTAGVGLALKTAIEAAYVSPDGNAGVLLSVQQVNRAGN